MLRRLNLLGALVCVAGCEAAPAAVPVGFEPVLSGENLSTNDCLRVSGPVVAAFAESTMTHPVDGDLARIEGSTTGDVVSNAYAWVDFLSHPPADPEWTGAIRIRMRHLYVDPGDRWMVWTSDEGVLAPLGNGVYQFSNRLNVAGGSGDFHGATGMLSSQGTVDFVANEIRLEYHGQLCVPAE